MKIVSIFADKLFAFHYPSEEQNEYMRLLDLWTPEYLVGFAEENKKYIKPPDLPIEVFINRVLDDVETLEDEVERHATNASAVLDVCFRSLYNQENCGKILSLQKKKCRYLRLYAIRIDKNCYVITGGAIKLTATMQEHPLTLNELEKLKQCKNYLQSQSVFDNDSFYEFISE
jgi:hypothetical protein